MRRRLVTAALCALLPAPAFAFTLVAQQREVSVDVTRETRTCSFSGTSPICFGGPGTQITFEYFPDSESAPDLADWSASASIPGFDAVSELESTATATTLAAHGTRFSDPGIMTRVVTPPQTVTNVLEHHATTSHYEMQFSLDEATSYTLSGHLSLDTGAGFTGEVTRIQLTGPGGAVVTSHVLDPSSDCDFAEFYCNLAADISEAGVLAPGIYTITAEAIGVVSSSASPMLPPLDAGDFDFVLSLTPAPPVVTGITTPGSALLAALLGAFGSRRLRRAPIRSAWRIERFLPSRSS